jgi:hypothetical protein
MLKSFCRRSLICILLYVAPVVSFSQEVAAETEKSALEAWREQRVQEFDSYRFEVEGSKPKNLTLEPRAILNWTNPERGTFFGATFLWTCEGQPELIVNTYGRGRSLRHEFDSVSTDPIVAERAGSRVHRFQPGIQWQDLTNVPKSADSPALRLTQMRRLAERFRVSVLTKKPNQDEQSAPLRLLTQPVYRSPQAAADDVALFMFVQGNDPECALLLEATIEKKWRYALRRQTMAGLKVDLDGRQVLELPRLRELPPEPESAFLFLVPLEGSAGPAQ